MLYAIVRVKHLSMHGIFPLGIFHKSWPLTVFNWRLGLRRCSVKELSFVYVIRNAKQRNLGVRPVLSCVYVMSRLQLVTVGCVFNFATELCRKAIDGRGLFGVGARAQIGKLTAQVVKWSSGLYSIVRSPDCLARGDRSGEQLARGYARKFGAGRT